jgi:hypothetical protein
VYAIFAVGATARSVIQITRRLDEAPVAYMLSAFAAVVYVVATIALARGNRTSRKVAYVAIGIEMAGVIVIGALSLLVPDAFPRATVWSTFGGGYLFIPLILPPLALWWLRRTE